MTLAFLISAHTDPVHLARLVKSLPEDAAFFIHVDLKTLFFRWPKTPVCICFAGVSTWCGAAFDRWNIKWN